jgi:Fic family protein
LQPPVPGRWYTDIDRIKRNFAKEQKMMPKSVREKELLSCAIRFTYDT